MNAKTSKAILSFVVGVSCLVFLLWQRVPLYRCDLSDDEAVNIAKEYLDSAGLSHSFITEEKGVRGVVSRGYRLWLQFRDFDLSDTRIIKVDDAMTLGVSCENKNINAYFNDEFIHNNVDNPGWMNREDALLCFEKYKNKMPELKDFISIDVARVEDYGLWVNTWNMKLRRKHGDVTYLSQKADLNIQSDTCKLVGFSWHKWGGKPINNIKLSRNEAIYIAQKILMIKNGKKMNIDNTELKLVNELACSSYMSPIAFSNETIYTWVFELSNNEIEGKEKGTSTSLLAINAETSKVINISCEEATFSN